LKPVTHADASLSTSNKNKVSLRCSQKLFFGDSTTMKLFGMFEESQPARVRVQARVVTQLFFRAVPPPLEPFVAAQRTIAILHRGIFMFLVL